MTHLDVGIFNEIDKLTTITLREVKPRPFEEARAFVRSLKLRNRDQFAVFPVIRYNCNSDIGIFREIKDESEEIRGTGRVNEFKE